VATAHQSHRELLRASWNCSKRLAAITIAFSLCAAAFANTVAYYRFENGPAGSVATSITDSSGNGHNGSVLGSPIYSSAVPANQTDDTLSLSLGTADGVTFNYPFPFNTLANATLEFWVNPSVTSVQYPSLFWTTTASGDQNRFNITVVPGGGVGIDYREPNGNLHSLVGVGGNAVPVGQWTFVAFVKNGNTYTLYVNNSPVSTVTDSNPNLPTSTGWTINGRGTEQPSSCCQLVGLVDEVRISDQALSPSQFLDNASVSKVLPQLAFGGGWYTAAYFTNTTAGQVSFEASFAGGDGTPLNVPSVGGSSTNLNIAPHGTAIIEAPNVGQLTQGYISVSLPAGVTGYGVFRSSVAGRNDQEAVVPLSSAATTTSTLIWDDTSYVTAVAVVNPSSVSVSVSITVWDSSGNVIGTSSIPLAAKSKTAAALRDLPGLGGVVGKRGSAQFTVAAGNVAVLGLRFNNAAFTSIPTADK